MDILTGCVKIVSSCINFIDIFSANRAPDSTCLYSKYIASFKVYLSRVIYPFVYFETVVFVFTHDFRFVGKILVAFIRTFIMKKTLNKENIIFSVRVFVLFQMQL